MIYYPSSPSKAKPRPVDLPRVAPAALRHPENYIRDDGLADAVNVALALRQPLIVTGEPGTGKTVLAFSVAWELGLDEPLVFETKSTSQAKDLFYFYDTLGRFTAQQLGGQPRPAKDYITYNALGMAIARTNDRNTVAGILPSDFAHAEARRSVVLIDEIEKAPRDFPNDILNEIERMYFRVPELGNVCVAARDDLLPVVIMTNNSEKSLPDAFLRRCIYYHIPFPTAERLEAIAIARLVDYFDGRSSPLLIDAIGFLQDIRTESESLEKPPGTAEFLNWLTAMHKLGADPSQGLSEQAKIAARASPALVKISGDLARVRQSLGVVD